MTEDPTDELTDGEWWREATLYQIYPRSFADSTGDGVGDLPGIIGRLDHLAWLGVDGIWLDPITVSPNADWGYDVADYYAVDPSLGTLDDVDELVAQAARRDLRVILDIVPNHTSIEHPWFATSRSSRDDPRRDFYVWADPSADGGPPNNWVSTFGGPAWTFDDTTDQYYLHNFTPDQPDLNWWSDEVRDEFDRIFSFWFDRGIAGFRIDVAHMIIKDAELRDNPPATNEDSLLDQIRGQRPVYNSNRPEVHEVHRRWRALADSYDPPRLLVAETFVDDVATMASYYGDGDEVHLAFNITLVHRRFEPDALRTVVEETEAALPTGCWPVWMAGNHDLSRFPTRWANGDEARTRLALLMVLGLRGTAFLYYGDELGLVDTEIPPERVLDPVGITFPGFGRDPERSPMPWSPEPGAGFTAPGGEPWLPFGDIAATNVADQRRDPASTLSFSRDLIQLRAAIPDLRGGSYETMEGAPDGVWAWRRGGRVIVALNFSDDTQTLSDVTGLVRLTTTRRGEGERVEGELELAPRQGAIVWLDAT